VNIGRLAELEGDAFDPQILMERGVVKKLGDGLKILGDGELNRRISVRAHVFSKAALDKIQKAGGAAEVLKPR
jgi:large subunit ribosomal protein L15